MLLDAAVVGDVFWRGTLEALANGVDIAYGLDELEARGLVLREGEAFHQQPIRPIPQT